MALVLTCNKNREMTIKIGDEIEIIVCIEKSMIKAVIAAPKEMKVDRTVVHVAGFTEKKSKFYRGSKDVQGNC